MNSTNKRKSRRKVIVSKKHNLSINRSLSSTKCKFSDNSKFRIKALLKNNKSLALALQDAKGELSEKQNLLENAAKHFKNIMQARVMMLGMYSDLKSFVERFGGALSLLSVDDFKMSDLIVPFKSCGQFKSKVKKLAESVEQVLEETSFSLMAENGNCDISMTESANQIIPSDHNPSVDFNAMEVTDKCDDKQTANFEAELCLPLKVSIENTSTFNEVIPNAVASRLPVAFCENLEEAADPSVGKTTSPAKDDTLRNRESSGTPRLSIVSINTLKNSEVLPNCIDTVKNSEVLPNFEASVSFKVPSSPGEVITDALNTHASSLKVTSSKIPRLYNLSTTSNVKLDLPGNDLKQSYTSSQKNLKISENSDFGMARRKTFVVKNNDTLATNSESNSISNIPEIGDENTTTKSRQTNSRKTFVIQVKDAPKDERKSISNRRKTFVKKNHTTDIKIPKSMKNRRETFVLSETKEDCNNEIVTNVTEISKEHITDNKIPKSMENRRETFVLPETKEDCNNEIVFNVTEISKKRTTDNKIPKSMKNRRETFVLPETKEDCNNEIVSNVTEISKKRTTDNKIPKSMKNRRETLVLPETKEDCNNEIVTNVTEISKKRTTDNKIPKSMKNRRETFVLPETKEDCNNEIVTVTEISTSNDLVKDKCLLSERKLFEELPVVCDKINEITTFQETLDNVVIPSKIISLKNKSEQIPFQGKGMSKTNKITLEQEFELDINCDEKDGNSDVTENLGKAKNVNKKLSSGDTIEPSNICGISEECVQSVMPNDIEIIEVKDVIPDLNKCHNKRHSRPQKHVSYKIFLESSDSECESIPNLDFSFVKEPPNKPIPIRKRISGSQKKKVFVFDNRKPMLSKKSPSKVKIKKEKSVQFVEELNCVSHSNNTSIKNKDVIELSKFQENEKIMESVSGDSTCNKSSNNKNGSKYCETSNNDQEIPDSAVTSGKVTDISRSAPNEKLSASKSGENGIKNSLSLFNSPVIVSHKFLNAIESDKDLDCGKGKGNMICETKTNSRKECSKSSKNNQVINNPLLDYPVDTVSIQKSSKRNDSKKQSEQTVTADVHETNRSLLQNENKKQTKKKNKSTKKRKKSPANMSNDNTIVVTAEVHSPAQEYFTISETTGFNKENRSKLESENCLVLLNDIFKPTNIDMLPLSCKNKMVSNGRNILLKNPLSDNLSNIPPSVGDSHNTKNEEGIASNVQGIRISKRAVKINYSEPSLRKKMRK